MSRILPYDDPRVTERHVGPMCVKKQTPEGVTYLAARFGGVDARIAMGRILTPAALEKRRARSLTLPL
ncbi:hypothetical protein CL614_04275 [archaeon]|nr:hypothetical protein [archaeon]|tara:strand:+ start:87 stop:290 length:204 start_codon:yes stop_codon:yes gene_type:complete